MAEGMDYVKSITNISSAMEDIQKAAINADVVLSQMVKSIYETGSAADVLNNNFEGISPVFASMAEGIQGAKDALSSLQGGISTGIGLIKTLGNGVGQIPNAFSNAGKSIKETKAAFSNFGAAFTFPIGDIISNFDTWKEMTGEAFDAVLQKAAGFSAGFLKFLGIGAGIGMVVAGMGLLQQTYGDQINVLIENMMTKGPEIITSLCNGIVAALPALIEQGATLLNNLMLAITANLPALLAGGISIISALITGIAAQLPMLVPTAITLILTLVQGLLDNLPQLISSGLMLITGLVQGLVNAIPQIVAAIPALIGSLINGIVMMLPQIITTGITLIGQLAVGLIRAIPDLVGAIPQIIDSVKKAFTDINWGEVGDKIIKGIMDGLKAAGKALMDTAKELANMAWDALTGVFPFLSSKSSGKKGSKTKVARMGIGFKTNVPIREMRKGLGQALHSLQGEADIAMTAFGRGISYTSAPFMRQGNAQGFDFDEFERRQRRINRETKERPVFLNGRQVNRALKKGVPVTV